MTLGAVAIFCTVGCNGIREYSVRSYQGVLPMDDFRPPTTVTARLDSEKPNPSTPAAPPVAAPAAPTAPAAEPAKPAETPAPEPAKEK